MSLTPVVIIGASGYTGEELVRLTLRHPHLQLQAVTSRQNAGELLERKIPALPRKTDLRFSNPHLDELAHLASVFFLAVPHGLAAEYAVPLIQMGKIVIDLSADFRLREAARYEAFYGHPHPAPSLLSQACYALPEIRREMIPQYNLLAAPGCYPTSILLPLVPLLRRKLIEANSITITSASGVSGAGKKADLAYLFGEVNENFRAYGLPLHRHVSEIEQELSLAAEENVCVTFIPHLAPWHRGIWTTIVVMLKANVSEAEIHAAYERDYTSEPFISVMRATEVMPDMRNVQRTNRAEIAWHLDSRTGRLIVFSTIDNLGKGAASQAIQILNCRMGWPETTGLEG
ncbi:MAG: N-acetyl-gamma-glutamyl-phosphate reductase [Methylacidiphilales bacterium]|nr:N-acetyl-gamma-glutamyl-phosphate reductase [Candidatus Methylacidiphilales bacterium]MDW8349198.1 N-acetyl-gamma-glutamyl-phosphate reductase [Verrucomicrobiae bacterium]